MPARPPSGGSHAARPITALEAAAAPRPNYAGLLHRVPAILYTADMGEAGRWHYVSPQIEGILGFTPEQWCGDPDMWARRLHPDDAERVLAGEAKMADSQPGSSATEYRLLHRDGHPVWLRDDALLLADEDGVRRWHGVLSDITDRKEAEAELELRAAQQAAVARLGEHALEGASAKDLMREAVVAAAELLGLEIGAVIEHLPARNAFAFRVTHGLRGISPETLVPTGAGSQAGYSLLHGVPVIVADWETERRFARSPVLTRHGARSGLTVIIQGRREPYGVLGLHSTQLRRLTPGDVDFVQALANVLGDVMERQLTDDDIRHRALHDPLTGLPNRVLFMDRLQQSTERLRRRNSSLTAVLALDLDRFKLVNDSLGHRFGDELLAAAAPRLRQAVRSSDTVARFGGDEFGILLEDVAGEREAIEMAERIAGVFANPFVLDGTEHYMTTSIGIALGTGAEAAEDLIRDADAAMNRAKERGRARWELFDEAMRGRALSRLRVENDLRRALERRELTLDYQPLVSMTDRSLVGVEALVRWEHPQRGRIPPNEFIPVAEENGMIDTIGRWVLDHACCQAARWYRERPDAPPVLMSVNVSAAQVTTSGLAEAVAAALRMSGLDPSLLALELTESVLAGDLDELVRSLSTLKSLGVRLVLDDFGTGYSSLSYLTALPVSQLKIDRSFVSGMADEANGVVIVRSV
ncbi:MAG TPA: EAL domain-containing protein, partial [Solirubrobacteraceae bacterium]|nr:EAL domain-containing protein [Solirubrobacteraceae bacterium]